MAAPLSRQDHLQRALTLMREVERDIVNAHKYTTPESISRVPDLPRLFAISIDSNLSKIAADLEEGRADDETYLDFESLKADFRCLKTRVSIAKRQEPALRWQTLAHSLFYETYYDFKYAIRSLPQAMKAAKAEAAAADATVEPTTICGTQSQYSILKSGKRVGDGACSYCAVSAIKHLWPVIKSGGEITPALIDAATRDGVAASPDRNYGSLSNLVRDDRTLMRIDDADKWFNTERLQTQRSGFTIAIENLYNLAMQQPDGMVAAGLTKNPTSCAIIIKLGAKLDEDRFYLYDSHGDTSDRAAGTPHGGAKAFVKAFPMMNQLIDYLNAKHPFYAEHGDELEMVQEAGGDWVDNYNLFLMTPVVIPSAAPQSASARVSASPQASPAALPAAPAKKAAGEPPLSRSIDPEATVQRTFSRDEFLKRGVPASFRINTTMQGLFKNMTAGKIEKCIRAEVNVMIAAHHLGRVKPTEVDFPSIKAKFDVAIAERDAITAETGLRFIEPSKIVVGPKMTHNPSASAYPSKSAPAKRETPAATPSAAPQSMPGRSSTAAADSKPTLDPDEVIKHTISQDQLIQNGAMPNQLTGLIVGPRKHMTEENIAKIVKVEIDYALAFYAYNSGLGGPGQFLVVKKMIEIRDRIHHETGLYMATKPYF